MSTKIIQRIGVIQTAKFIGTILFVISGIFCFPLAIIFLFWGDDGIVEGPMGIISTPLYLSLIPFMYLMFGFILGIFAISMYNLIADWIGGIEIELEDPEKVVE